MIATARDLGSLDDVPATVRLSLDVTDENSIARAVAAAGVVDVLVSNAGATVRAPLETVPVAEVAALFDLNTFGALRVAQAVLPQMRQRGSGRDGLRRGRAGQDVPRTGHPHLPLLGGLAGFRSEPINVEEVAQAVADTLDDPDAALRIPVGTAAHSVLAARRDAPDDRPFLAAPLDW